MKKILIILLCGVIVLGITGCSYNQKEQEEQIIENSPVEQKENLTMDKLKELINEKGKDLTWSDFKDFESTETGFGLHILMYKINDEYTLYIGGGYDENDKPLYIHLVSSEDTEKSIDIRESDINDFLNNM